MESTTSQLEEYLKWFTETAKQISSMNDWKYSSREEFTLKEGKYIQAGSQKLSEEEKEFLLNLLKIMNRNFKSKACFENATQIFLEAKWQHNPNMDLAYGEGFGQSIIPIHHAVVMLNGKPIDLTWKDIINDSERNRSPKNLLKRIEKNLLENDYYMVSFSIEELNAELLRNRVYGIMERHLLEKGRGIL